MAMGPSSRPLCTVCARKGLTTYWTVPYLRQGQVVVRNKYGGYWNKTRSTADSGGSSIPCMISITKNISTNRQNHRSSYLIMPYRTHSSRRGTRDKLVSTQDRDFPGFLPVCMKSSRGWSLSPAYPFLTVKHLQYALMRVTLSLHKNNVCSKSKWCCNRIKTPHKNIMPEFRMLAFKSMQRVHF